MHGSDDATATLRVHRPAVGRAGLRSFSVWVDSEPVGTVAEGATESFALAPGTHRVWVHLDWSGTPHHEVDLAPGQVLDIRVVFAGSGWNPLRDTPHELLALEVDPASGVELRTVAPPSAAPRRVRWTATSRAALVIGLAVLAAAVAFAGGVRLG